LDPEERLAIRRKQKLSLARYGRQSIFDWADVPVTELIEWYLELGELVNQEGDIQRMKEE
jgi:hypothetical protein